MDANGVWYGLMGGGEAPKPRPRILIIGAGSRGNAYARAIENYTGASVVAVAEPIDFKRKELGRQYIWPHSAPQPEQEFTDWRHFLAYERTRRKRAADGEEVEAGVDAAFICTLDEQHAEIIIGLSPLNLHIMCEKPLATTLDDCLRIYSSLLSDGIDSKPQVLFGIGHVLRYSPHNMLLRRLLLQDRAVGDIISMEHTEPVGWWHFSHSYVRGNWRKESTTAPSLLTKSCHDIDFLLWLLCSPTSPASGASPHLPSQISSSGHLNFFRKSRKPPEAGDATNCLSCPIERSCQYSAKQIYLDRHLRKGNTSWPVKIVNPEIEECHRKHGRAKAGQMLLSSLAEDYTSDARPNGKEHERPYFGRCVWEADNDVCDDQFVTITWDDNIDISTKSPGANSRQHAKTASFHMIAHTEAICERRGRVYGTKGEVTYDSRTIRVGDFGTGESKMYYPEQGTGSGHGDGDVGLTVQFVRAVDAVKNHGMSVVAAQEKHIGCSIDDILRSHALVFAAEEARRESKVVDWKRWWAAEVDEKLKIAANLEHEYEMV